MSTSADSTRGGGTNTVGDTLPTTVASAHQARRTDGMPYALVPGPAARRSPTSSCTITSMRSIAGAPASRSSTSGVAMLYGRFATSTHDG